MALYKLVLAGLAVAVLVGSGTTSGTAVTPVAAVSSVPDEFVVVAEIVDGDTFKTATGDVVRVLGIDSCEMSTPGGRKAKEDAAVFLLQGGPITLHAQPGAPDRDRYGRLLRYVQTPLGDLGKGLVVSPHTGVYAGKNDASAEYVNELRTIYDTDGRNCSIGSTPTPPAANTDVHHDDHQESKFCRKRKWC